MDRQFDVGWKAIPRIGTTHSEFFEHIEEEFTIIKIEKCSPGEGCMDCHDGDPIVELNHKEVHLCGYGVPNRNFIFRPNILDWDE